MKKRYLLLLLVVVLFPIFVYAYPKATSDFFVNDYAGVLTGETKEHILDKSVNLYNKKGAQIVVVTVEDLEGKDIETYALELGREFGIGSAKDNNGILLLLSISDRKYRIEVGYGLEGVINDAKAGRIIDTYAVPYFGNDDWNNGIIKSYDAVLNEVCISYDIDCDVEVAPMNDSGDWIELIIPIIFFIIILCVALRKSKHSRSTWIGGSFGGFGGGSSGGGFSGGGGSFGGGGASRGF